MTEPENVSKNQRHQLVAQVMGAGAIIAIVSTIIKWASVSLDLTARGGQRVAETKVGLETTDGKIVLVIGLAFAVFAVMIYTGRAAGKVLPAVGLGLAALILLITIVDIASTKTDTRKDFERELEKSTKADPVVIQTVSKYLSVKLGAGLYIAVGSGAVLLIGSALGLGLRKPDEFVEAPPAPPIDAPPEAPAPPPAGLPPDTPLPPPV